MYRAGTSPRRRLLLAAPAAPLYAAAWAVPATAASLLLAAAVVLIAAAGRTGGLAGVSLCLLAPLPLPVRAALALSSLAYGELLERGRRSARELARRSFTDRLTGLHNYDYFAEVMTAELARVRRYGGRVSLVLLDIDRFKHFNDHHGHAAGNRVLQAVGRVVSAEKRDADVAARFGGEEFAVLVAGRAADAVVIAERLRAAIAEVPGPAGGRLALDDRVTASAGAATFPDHAQDAESLFELADRALYAAKHRGRDCVVTAAELHAGQAAPLPASRPLAPSRSQDRAGAARPPAA